jgi:hypothetical protein
MRVDFFRFLFAVLLLLAGIVTPLKTRDASLPVCCLELCPLIIAAPG